MPPQHAQGDVLDRALAVARSKAPPPAHVAANPLLTKPQANFFGAVAGTRSPLNHQSSRLAHPLADNPFLGGGNVGSVATPAQQALLARSNANDKTAPAPIRRQATTIAQNYVKGADTEKVIPAHKTAAAPRGGGAGVQGAALTAPNAIAQGQRALGLLGANIPLGDAAPAAIRGLQALGLPDVERQQVIKGFASDPTLAQPGVRAELVARALAQNHSLPAHPTSAQLLTAAISPDQHKGSYWDAINPLNIAKDAIYTPVYSFEGGQALGHATREALPSGLGGQGDTSGLKAIGEAQLKTLEHPGAFIQQHPFQAALAVVGGAKALGGIGGKLAGTEAAARDVTLSHYPLTPIDRGELSTNLATRGAQKLSDTILAKGPEQFQSNALKNRVVGTQSRIVRERAIEDRKVYSDYKDAGKGIKPREKQFLLQNAAQGVTPAEREAFYKSLGETDTRSAQANLASAQGERFGNGPLTDKQQAYVDAARKLAAHRAQTLKDAGDLTNEAELRNDYQTLTHVRASQGDPTATKILDVERHMQINALNKDITWKQAQAAAQEASGRTSHFTQRELGQMIQKRGALQNAIQTPIADTSPEALDVQHEALVKQFAGEQQGAQPFRVGKERPKVKSQFNFPGRAVRANADLPISGIGKTRTFGDQLRSGNFIQNNRTFERQLFEPSIRADARRFVEAVSDPDSGLGAYTAENGRPLTDVEKANYSLLNRANLRTTPKNANDTIDAASATNREADIVRTAKDLNQAWETPGLDRVPDDGDFVLVPNPVKEQVDQQVSRIRPGSIQHQAEKATHAFKSGVLMTRPTYPLTNLANGILQGLPEHVGPLSWARAARGSLPTLPGVEDAGFVAREFGHGASQTARGYLDEGRPIRALAQATIGNYVKGIRNAAISVDNVARKATANKLAVGEAKKLAGWGKFHRTFGHVNDEIVGLIQKMADGDTPETRAAAERVLKKVNDLQGDYSAMRTTPGLDFAVPFHRWTRFISKLMLKTLPLKYPGHALAAYQLGDIGQQAAAQKGALPQYLSDVLDVGGSPLSRIGLDFSKTNPIASLGTTFEPDVQGNINPQSTGEAAISSLSPFASIGYGALTGKDLQTGNPLLNGAGKPMSTFGDSARYLGAQAAGFVPPLGALAGGLTGRPATSIPLPGLTQTLPPSAKRTVEPTGPTIDLPLVGKVPIIPLANQLIPLRVTDRNETVDQLKAFKNFALTLRQQLQAELKAKAHTQADATRIEAKFAAIDAEAQKRQAYYTANPKALAALLASGTAK